MPEIDFGVSDLPISRVWISVREYPGRVCPPDSVLRFRPMSLKGMDEFTGALFNRAVTPTRRNNNRLLRAKDKIQISVLHLARLADEISKLG